ncbi:uncharacterized protein F5Z01DRAFT_107648 [Emericellopsis atlantica]|uniref:Zn(2)-C6 fungal-type domain-containing protein n=1 Tax=Emericellopsis atlantica TaxID=2614577 RepID=A0A9P8CP52_9HYPO|nr:uncharacterized protein F5Z01DRAFT_107648 [Emericellopsis atlantica]KAG9254474.1 hypothetical protein F5Z01DRAFT_107648 [Emericellopsis atlantica]
MPESTSMDRKYKPIRPAFPSPTAASDADSGTKSSSNDSSQTNTLLPRKRIQVKVACDACRAKKSACDGKRPTCAACERRGSVCTFVRRGIDSSDSSPSAPGADRNTDASELLGLLTSVPPAIAAGFLEDIKDQGDISSALAQIKQRRDAPGIVEVSQPLVPPDQGAVEFELMCRQPIMYPPLVALDLTLDPTIGSSKKLTWAPSDEDSVAVPPNESTSSIDPRLSAVDMAVWTKVLVSNEDAAQALAWYFETDHPVLGLFDADLFLEDLSLYNTRFCTEFMVNALSSWAFMSSLAHAVELGESFLLEATGMWERGEEVDSLPTVAALQFVSLTADILGKGHQALEYLRHAVQMGQRLGLFDVVAPAITDPSDFKAACQCAWGLFSYANLHGFHYQRNELGTLPPPALPIPHSPASLLVHEARHQSAIFPYFAQLWAIVQGIVSRYCSVDQLAEPLEPNHHFVRSTMQRLLHWGAQLPLSLVRGNRITHQGITLHIMFHSAVLFGLRPLVSEANHASLMPDSETLCTAQEISRASANQLRRLVTIYQSQFFRNTLSILWHTGCLYLANAAMPSLTGQPAQVSDLYLALAGYRSLYPQYPVALTIYKGLLAIAVARRLVTQQEALATMEIIQNRQSGATSPPPPPDPSTTCFIVDLDLALTDQANARIDRVAQKFDDMVMFDEFTVNRADVDGGVAIH